MATALTVNNIAYNTWLLEYLKPENGWRLAAGLMVVPNSLISMMLIDVIGHKTHSRSFGELVGSLNFALPLVTISSGNPWYLVPSVIFTTGWVIYNSIQPKK